MKKLIPDYFGWGLLLLYLICVTLFFFWAFNQTPVFEDKYIVDTSGIGLKIATGTILTLYLNEIWVLISFLQVEYGRIIEVDESKGTIHIIKNGKSKLYQISDLTEMIFSDHIFNSKLPTNHLSYSQLNFKSTEPLIITSFLLNIRELENLLGNGSFKRVKRNRRIFEKVKDRK